MDPAAPDAKKRTLIETRGEGGYAVAPGSPADVHETGRPYEHFSGPPLDQVQNIGVEERDILFRCARSFDRTPAEDPKLPQTQKTDLPPGDDFNTRGPTWAELLEPHGWTVVHQRDGVTYWRRPGKTTGSWSATTGRCKSKSGRELFYVFSSNAAPFAADRGYDKFGTYAFLNYGGNLKAAAKALAAQGYGKKRPGQTESANQKPSVGSVNRQRYIPLPPYRPFPMEALPPVVQEYVAASAEAIGCDPALVALPALATLAGAIGNSRAVVLKRGWIEPAVIWSTTVAESGGHKSPAFHAAVQPLMELQLDAYDQHKEAMEEHKRALEEWQSASKDDRGEKPEAPKEPPSFITNDTTIETLGELLRDAPKGLLVARDELDGWFSSFTRYKGKGSGGSDRAGWLELHRAGTLRVDRLTREQKRLIVRRACVSVTGTIQPSVLARALDQEALQAGLGARFLLAMPPKHRRVWTEKELPEDLSNRYQELLRSLLALPLENTTKRKPYYLGLSLVAKETWVRFFNEWGNVQYGAEGEQASAFAKIEAYASRLALLHHIVAHVAADADDRRSITQASMEAGITLVRWFAYELTRVYTMLHEAEEERQIRKLVEWIAEHGSLDPDRPQGRRIRARDLQRSNRRRWPNCEAAEADLENLISTGLGKWIQEPSHRSQGGGRPNRWFEMCVRQSDVSDTWFSDPENDPSDVSSDTWSTNNEPPSDKKAVNPFCAKALGNGAPIENNQVSETSDCRTGNSGPDSTGPNVGRLEPCVGQQGPNVGREGWTVAEAIRAVLASGPRPQEEAIREVVQRTGLDEDAVCREAGDLGVIEQEENGTWTWRWP